ncbi:hypothetical protein OIU74_022098 [Salix koriyanagi]|uniref:Uncharacterized protein n=1 Tax=Salix koriyanagi TaxID=2511006 RepID=A0A9Q0WJC8_9ROSI|nr:hypothetical protein OIU74_022098 [Salix koriyanagi]
MVKTSKYEKDKTFDTSQTLLCFSLSLQFIVFFHLGCRNQTEHRQNQKFLHYLCTQYLLLIHSRLPPDILALPAVQALSQSTPSQDPYQL